MKTNIAAAHRGLGKAGGSERGFTLVDLVVVIATIAMLAMLILPALAGPSGYSGRTVCVNNLRQMGLASNMYATDNKDGMAFPDWGNPSPGPGWLYTGACPAPTPSDPKQAYTGGLWFQYVQNPNSYRCAVDLQSVYYAARANKLCSYVMNGAVAGFPSLLVYRSCKVTDVWNPACYLLWETDEYSGLGALAFNDASSYPDRNEGLGCLHSATGGDILSVGGYVQFVTIQKFRVEQNKSGKTLAWWSPFSASGR